MKKMKWLLDNKFWYVGYTSTEMGNKEFDKAFCFIVRNPLDRSWKRWEEIQSFHKRKHEERMTNADYQKEYEDAFNEYRKVFNEAIDKTI